MQFTLYFIMLLFIKAGQPDAGPIDTLVPAETILNVSYGKDSLQKMDVYLPEGRSQNITRSFVLIHGGSWNKGNKSDFNPYVDSIKRRFPGYAIFNLNYRLYNGGHQFPAQENDVKQAIDFIVHNASEYQVNHDSLVLLGASAGGHLALLQAYKYTKPKIVAVIDFFGPTDLTAMYRKPWHPYLPVALELVTGTNPNKDAERYLDWSPVHFVTTSSTPTLIFHGAKDQLVDISQSRALKEKLENAGVSHELVIYPEQRHGWHGSTLSHSFNKIQAFLEKNMN